MIPFGTVVVNANVFIQVLSHGSLLPYNTPNLIYFISTVLTGFRPAIAGVIRCYDLMSTLTNLELENEYVCGV